MIQELIIRNFKSIKDLKIPCKKLNVFIGEPNSGKSNIIEALALQSQSAIEQELNKNIFRYKTIGDLFYDYNINTAIEVITDERGTSISYAINDIDAPLNEFHFFLNSNIKPKTENSIHLQHDGKAMHKGLGGTTNIRYYEFKRLSNFQRGNMTHLSVPFGENMPVLLLANKELKDWVSEFFNSKGLTLTLRPTESDMDVSKFVDNTIYSYPYFSTSETLQRVVFYEVAIKSNFNSVLLFDEPETNTFPFYTKFIGERIALDASNQFFVTTHNPYLLLSLIEKSKFEDLNVCLVQMKNYETKVTVLNESQISQVLDLNSDIFFNFDQLISE